MTTVELYVKAKEMQVKAHEEQKYGEYPYSYHIEHVEDVFRRFYQRSEEGLAAVFIAICLHDALEDTSLTREEIQTELNEDIATLVWRVTDEPGKNRKERKEKTYLKTREDERAIIIKLADRIANVESCQSSNNRLLKMYQKEHAEFVQALRPFCTTVIAEKMWVYLGNIL